jgi:hypothetical protein
MGHVSLWSLIATITPLNSQIETREILFCSSKKTVSFKELGIQLPLDKQFD